MNYGFSRFKLLILKDKQGRNGIFTFYHFKGTKLPLFGYKIHVSATRHNLLKIRKIVSNYCRRKRINFKFISTKKMYLTSLTKSFDRTFIGKYITIYPENSDHAKLICEELYQLLSKEKGPVILTDRSYKDSIIQYRYGSFIKEYPQGSGKIIDSDGKEFFDDRVPGKYKPYDIKDLFEQEDFEITEKIKNYVIKTPVYFSSYGGVYLVQKEDELDLEEPIYYIIKEARKNLGITETSDPLTRKLHEAELAKSLNLDFLPKFHECFYIQGNFYLVFDYSPGMGLDKWKDEMMLNSIWQLSPNRKRLIENAALRLIDRFISLLGKAKEARLVLNDVKANNFVWDGADRLTFIDLDCSFLEGKKPIVIINRYNKRDRRVNWRGDIVKTGYLIIDLLSGSEFIQNRFTNHKQTVEFFLYFAKKIKLKKKLRDRLYKLLNFNGKNIENVSIDLSKGQQRWIEILSLPKFLVRVNKNNISKLNLIKKIINLTNNGKGFAKSLWDNSFKSLKEGKRDETKKNIDLLLENVIDVAEGYKIVVVDKKLVSIYLNNGSSKLILLLILYDIKFKVEDYKELIIELLRGIEGKFIMNSSFIEGGWGVVYTLFEAFKYLKNSKYLRIAESIAYILLRFFKDQKTGNYFNASKVLLNEEEKENIECITKCFRIEKIK